MRLTRQKSFQSPSSAQIKTGLIVPQSAEGVADGVRRLMTLPHLRQSLCENLRKTDFGAEKDIKVFENILNGEK